jgi:hypothetical protein
MRFPYIAHKDLYAYHSSLTRSTYHPSTYPHTDGFVRWCHPPNYGSDNKDLDVTSTVS